MNANNLQATFKDKYYVHLMIGIYYSITGYLVGIMRDTEQGYI